MRWVFIIEIWYYIMRIKRGRKQGGRFRAMIYEILYVAETRCAVSDGGDRDRDTSVGGITESPPPVADSSPPYIRPSIYFRAQKKGTS